MCSRYCDQLVTDDINNCAERLLSSLMAFQDKQFLKDPTKVSTVAKVGW